MNSEEEFIQNYQSNEDIWNSKNSNTSEKSTAWRKQLLLLEHLSRSSDDTTYYDVLKHHFDKLDVLDEVSEGFLNDRVSNVANLLGDFKSFKNCKPEESFPDLDEDLFEPSCHGDYESCANSEITDEQLRILKPDPPLSHMKSFSIHNTEQTSSHKPSTQAVPHGSMANFLQNTKKPTPSTTSTLANNFNQNLNNYPQKAFTNQSNNHPDNSSNNENAFKEFRTAREELMIQNLKKYGANPSNQGSGQTPLFNYGQTKKSLGSRRNVRSGFIPPIRNEENGGTNNTAGGSMPAKNYTGNVASNFNSNVLGSIPNAQNALAVPASQNIEPSPPLANIDPKMIELIQSEIMHQFKPIAWDDIAGLEYAKSIIKEAVVYPLLRPDIFTGLRRPPRGILLFGPPGTGKTLIGKCIASQSKSTFFSISASSLTSKWIGDGEKMVRALFAVAVLHQPSVVFIDEIDSLLSQRSETEHESSRRLKNEFLIQLDGAATSEDDRILIVGATNRPQELDEAARRRLVRRLYIPLPEHPARIQILNNLLKTVRNDLSDDEIQEIGKLTEGYSGADMDTLCREASMEPIRSIPPEEMAHFKEDNVRPVCAQDFRTALQNVRPSVSQDDLKQYLEWNRIYGAKR